MIELAENKIKIVDKKTARGGLISLENFLKNADNSFEGDTINCPLKHSFSDGIYVREITIPKGMLLVGKIHKHEHPNFLLKGEVVVYTEERGEERLVGPCSMISSAGTKRALYAVTDLVWTTIHANPTNTRDLSKIEEMVIAKNYNEYEKFLNKNKSIVKRLKNLLIKKLSK